MNTRQTIVNRVRGRLLEKPGAQKGFVKLYICEAELYRRLIEKIPCRVLAKAGRQVIAELEGEGVTAWFGNIGG